MGSGDGWWWMLIDGGLWCKSSRTTDSQRIPEHAILIDRNKMHGRKFQTYPSRNSWFIH
jgi:hypothetical protein